MHVLQSIADGIAQDLDRSTLNANVLARVIITRLAGHEVELTSEEVMTVLGLLRTNGHLGAFLGLVRYPQDPDYETIGALLKRNRVPIEFVYQNFDIGWIQYNEFFIGYVGGAASSAIEGLLFIARLLGNAALDLLAATAATAGVIDSDTEKSWRQSPQEFFAAIHEFVFHPLVALSAGAQRFVEAYRKAIYELDFLTVGRINGEIVVILLTLPGAAKSAARLIGRGGRLVAVSVAAAKLSFQQLLTIIPRADLARFVAGPTQVFVSGSAVLVTSEDLATVLAADGKPLGSIQLSEIFDGLRGSIEEVREQLGEGPESGAVQVAEERADVQRTREQPSQRRGRKTEPAETDIEESPSERARLAGLAREFYRRFLGNDPDIDVQLRRIQRTEAGRAQTRAVTPTESPGAVEHELVIELRDQNLTFSPDGLEPAGDGHYAFLEHKEAFSVWERPDLTRTSKINEFRAMMERDAGIQRRLARYGCEGFTYSTNSPDLLDIFAELIAEFKTRGIDIFSVRLLR